VKKKQPTANVRRENVSVGMKRKAEGDASDHEGSDGVGVDNGMVSNPSNRKRKRRKRTTLAQST